MAAHCRWNQSDLECGRDRDMRDGPGLASLHTLRTLCTPQGSTSTTFRTFLPAVCGMYMSSLPSMACDHHSTSNMYRGGNIALSHFEAIEVELRVPVTVIEKCATDRRQAASGYECHAAGKDCTGRNWQPQVAWHSVPSDRVIGHHGGRRRSGLD